MSREMRTAGPAVGMSLLALCLVAFVCAQAVVLAGHVAVGIGIAAGASVAGLVVLLVTAPIRDGGRR